MSEFTKEQLRMMLSVDSLNVTSNLAKALLAQMERAENAEAERDEARVLRVPPSVDELTFAQMAAMVAKAEVAAIQAERDRLKGELETLEDAFCELPYGPETLDAIRARERGGKP